MSISFGGNGGALQAEEPVIVPLDIEAAGPDMPLAAGTVIYLTHTTVEMDLEPGGLRVVCPSPGVGSLYLDLLADGVPMTPAPLQVPVGGVRIVAPTTLKPEYRQLPPLMRLEASLLSVPPGYALWKGLRVVFLVTAQLPEPVLIQDSAGNAVHDDDDVPVARSMELI